MKYDAFISYRHTPLDLEMAKKVHAGLETYHVPKAVQKKTGKKKIQRVFRDQEELPIGSDLDDNITGALKESEYLIVICSPNTPESVWVSREIETFIKLHDRNHVLAVLIEGEPNESFPQQLLVDESGAPVEPLAADVRGANSAERNKKFKTEILRLAAPVLGCTYDDLKQRHRERIIRRTISFVSAGAAIVAAAGAAFGIYNARVAARMTALANEKAQLADEKTQLADEKTQLAEEVLAEFEEKQKNQSKFYAQLSQNVLAEGDREAAALIAIEGLPSADNDRPFVAEAEYALADSLYAYSDGTWYDSDRVLDADTRIGKIYRNEAIDKLIATDFNETTYVWDVDTWNLDAKIGAEIAESGYFINIAAASADDGFVYVCNEDALIKYDFEGNKIYSKPLASYARTAFFSNENGVAVCVEGEVVEVFDIESGNLLSTYRSDSGISFSSTADYNYATNEVLVAQYDYEVNQILCTYINLNTGEHYDIALAGQYVLKLQFSPLGNAIAITTSHSIPIDLENATVELIDIAQRKATWSRTIGLLVSNKAEASLELGSHSFTADDGSLLSEIVIAIESKYITIDEATGLEVVAGNLVANCMDIRVATTSSLGFAACSDGNIQIFDFHDGKVYDDYGIYTKSALLDVIMFPGIIVCRASTSPKLKVYAVHTAPDLVQVGVVDKSQRCVGTDPKGRFYATASYDFGSNDIIFYNFDGNIIYETQGIGSSTVNPMFNYDGTVVFPTRDGVAFINPLERTTVMAEYEKMGVDFMSVKNVYYSLNRKYCVLWESWNLIVMDVETRSCLYTSEFDVDHMLGSAAISEDGKTIYVSEVDHVLYEIDLATGTRRDYSNDKLVNSRNAAGCLYISVSPDKKYVAMGCKDGMLRIIDCESDTEIYALEYNAPVRPFISFTQDGNHLITQADDRRVFIWDMEKGSYSNIVELGLEINKFVYDEEDGLLSIGDGYNTLLLETGDFGTLALVYGAMDFLTDSNKFLIRSNYDLYTSKYKNYEELLELAKQQFPGAELSEADKTEYNID